MSFVVNDDCFPVTLTAQPMTDEEFDAFCAEHPDLNFEMTAEGEIIAIGPTHFLTGASNSAVGAQLTNWARQDRRGIGCDSSTGFVLADGARRSPDASWTLKSRIKSLDPRERRGFLHPCPDFVIEIKSGSDRPRTLRNKMREYMENGAPDKRSIESYRPESEVTTLTGVAKIEREGPVSGFVLNLTYVWDPMTD